MYRILISARQPWGRGAYSLTPSWLPLPLFFPFLFCSSCLQPGPSRDSLYPSILPFDVGRVGFVCTISLVISKLVGCDGRWCLVAILFSVVLRFSFYIPSGFKAIDPLVTPTTSPRSLPGPWRLLFSSFLDISSYPSLESCINGPCIRHARCSFPHR